MADLKNQKIKDTYQSLLQTDASGNLQNLTGGTPTLIISGQTTLTGGVVSANPTPRIKFDDYYDNNGGPSVSHIDLYGGTYGFGITAFDLDYTSDKNHRFYANGQSTPGLTIDGDTKMVSINNAGTPAYNLDVTGDIRCTDDLFVNDDLVVDGFSSLDSVRIGGTQTDPGTGNLYVENNLGVDGILLNTVKTIGGVGVGTLQPTHKLTVSGGTSGNFVTYNLNGGRFTLQNGSNKLSFENGATTGELTAGDSIRYTSGGEVYTNIVLAIIDNNLAIIENWQGGNHNDTDTGLLYSSTNSASFAVYEISTATTPTFQISGGTVMSGSTDLLDIFAKSTQGGLADSAVQPADTFHIGTTSVAHNRGSGTLTLAGLTLTTPNIGTPSAGVLTNATGYPEAALPSSINAIKIADGTVTSTEFQYINTLSANAQTQINLKSTLASPTFTGTIAIPNVSNLETRVTNNIPMLLASGGGVVNSPVKNRYYLGNATYGWNHHNWDATHTDARSDGTTWASSQPTTGDTFTVLEDKQSIGVIIPVDLTSIKCMMSTRPQSNPDPSEVISVFLAVTDRTNTSNDNSTWTIIAVQEAEQVSGVWIETDLISSADIDDDKIVCMGFGINGDADVTSTIKMSFSLIGYRA